MPGPDEELASIDAELMVLEDSYKMLEAMALADGEIDATEQQGLDDLATQIREAKRERKELAADTDTTTAPGSGAGSEWDFVDEMKDSTFGSESAEVEPPADPDCGPSEPGPAIDPDGATDMIHGVEEAKAEEERATEEAYAEFVEDLGAPDEPELPPHLPDNDPGAELEAWFEGGGESGPPTEGIVAEGRQRELENIQKQQIALQRELLANPDNSEQILRDLEEANRAYNDIAGVPDANTKAEPVSTGGELLAQHDELYQAFLRAGDPETPDILSPMQECILEEMRGVSEDLAIEAERSVLAAKVGWDGRDAGLSEVGLEDPDDPTEFEDYGEGVSDAELVLSDLEDFDETLPGDSPSIPEMMDRARDAEQQLLQAGQLTDEELQAKLKVAAARYAYAVDGNAQKLIDGAKPIKKDNLQIGYIFALHEGHSFEHPSIEHTDLGLVANLYVDLDGNFLHYEETNEMFSSVIGDGLDAAVKALADNAGGGETAIAVGLETLIAVFGQPVEVILDASDLINATTRAVKDKDGNIYTVVLVAGMIFIPGSRAGKRAFRVGDDMIDADVLVKKIKTKDLDDIIAKTAGDDTGATILRNLDEVADGGAWGRSLSEPAQLAEFKDRVDVQELRESYADLGLHLSDEDLLKALHEGTPDEAVAKLTRQVDDLETQAEILGEFGDRQTTGRSQIKDADEVGKARSPLERDALEALGFDSADTALKKPSKGAQPQKFQVGNFAHDNAEDLIPDLPKGLMKEHEIRDYLSIGHEYKSYRADRVDFGNPKRPVVYEIKPDNPKQIAKGDEQGRLYAMLIDQKLGLPKGTTKWKVLTYDADAALRVMKKIGLL